MQDPWAQAPVTPAAEDLVVERRKPLPVPEDVLLVLQLLEPNAPSPGNAVTLRDRDDESLAIACTLARVRLEAAIGLDRPATQTRFADRIRARLQAGWRRATLGFAVAFAIQTLD